MENGTEPASAQALTPASAARQAANGTGSREGLIGAAQAWARRPEAPSRNGATSQTGTKDPTVKYRRPRRTAFVFGEVDEAELHVKVLPDGEVHVMSGISALIWLCAMEGQPDVAGQVAAELGLDPSDIRDEVAAFLDRLVEMALLEVVTVS